MGKRSNMNIAIWKGLSGREGEGWGGGGDLKEKKIIDTNGLNAPHREIW